MHTHLYVELICIDNWSLKKLNGGEIRLNKLISYEHQLRGTFFK